MPVDESCDLFQRVQYACHSRQPTGDPVGTLDVGPDTSGFECRAIVLPHLFGERLIAGGRHSVHCRANAVALCRIKLSNPNLASFLDSNGYRWNSE